MATRKNMAIIGATSAIGILIAESMVTAYDVLLMDNSNDDLIALTNRIKQQQPTANIFSLACSREASWEADVIVVAAPSEQLAAIAEKIKDVTNRKPVIHFSPTDAHAVLLQNLLPHANVVVVELAPTAANGRTQTVARIGGADTEALQISNEIIEKSFDAVHNFSA
jgi:8-hydroxy-5-deazaflavin:NADPH oxidoreductase